MSVEFSRSDDAESVQASLESKEQIRLLRVNTGDGAVLQPGCYYRPAQERERERERGREGEREGERDEITCR